ncbi:MAG: hypothetical protein RLZZ28_716 [Bacteroidota bacterium]
MNRETMLQQLSTTPIWDMIVIGGGATGLGIAVDAASRGYKILLVEQYDFSKGTSSRSTKLVHGGVRYLQQGNIKLVREALRERAYLLKNAPHLTSIQPFVIPVFSFWEKCFYAIGLSIYDLLSGKLSLGRTKILSKKKTIEQLPAINPTGLSGGILYYDGQFDDSRLCIDLAITAADYGAVVVNYCKASAFIKTADKISGVKLTDTLSGREYAVHAKSVINATGVFTDAVLQMDDAERHDLVSPSQGIHLVVDQSFFPGKNALMIPKTDDGRVLFAVPWHQQLVLGTTDTPIESHSIEPKALEEEIAFILKHFNRYGTKNLLRENVKTVYVGLRPLVKTKGTSSTSLLSRDHTLIIAASGLVTITGGKWTTYRKMAQDAVDNALFISRQAKKICITKDLAIGRPVEREKQLQTMILNEASLAEKMHPDYPYRKVELVYAMQFEMAINLEDILARRTRLLFLNARIAMEIAPKIAGWMQTVNGETEDWKQQQVSSFNSLASQYIL